MALIKVLLLLNQYVIFARAFPRLIFSIFASSQLVRDTNYKLIIFNIFASP